MSTTDAWRGHSLRATYITSSEPDAEPELVDATCGGCNAKPGEDDDPQAWFASHLKEQGAADYAVEFEKTWREYVVDGQGNLDEDKVARELFDYGVVMDQASQVYEELAGFSKPNTAAEHVIEYAQRQCDERQANLILHNLLPEIQYGVDRRAVIDYANGLHETAYEEYLRDKEMQAKFAAERAAKDGAA